MDTTRYSRSRGLNWRRIVTGIGLTALALGVSIAPATARPAASTAQLNFAHVVAGTRVPLVGQFIPETVFGSGDEDFAGHGPDIVARATLRTNVGSGRNLHVFLCMAAEEPVPDRTRVNECEFFLIFQAPAGQCIDSVSIGEVDEVQYRDDDHGLETFDGQVFDSFVERWEVTGDTPGDEAGTETGVNIFTHRFIVNTREAAC